MFGPSRPTVHIPAGTTTSADFCPVSTRLSAGTVGLATTTARPTPEQISPGKNDHCPCTAATFTPRPSWWKRASPSVAGSPDRTASYVVRIPRCTGLASGFLQTPPHHDAHASGSELVPPLPPGDFHPQAIAHAGRTTDGARSDHRIGPHDRPGSGFYLARTQRRSPEISRSLSDILATISGDHRGEGPTWHGTDSSITHGRSAA